MVYVGCRYMLARFSPYEWLCYLLIIVGTCWPGVIPMSGYGICWLVDWYNTVVIC